MSQEGIHAFISAEEAVHAHDGVERQNPATERASSVKKTLTSPEP